MKPPRVVVPPEEIPELRSGPSKPQTELAKKMLPLEDVKEVISCQTAFTLRMCTFAPLYTFDDVYIHRSADQIEVKIAGTSYRMAHPTILCDS